MARFMGTGESFTDKLREELYQRGFWGRRVVFRFRMENGKLKKVSGKLVYISHRPGRGFAIHLIQVRWLGQYFGPLEFAFETRQIQWIRHEIPKLLMAGRH